MQSEPEIYLSHARYSRTIEALTDLILKMPERCPFSAGSIAARLWIENEVKIALGEAGDIWPLTIRGDVFIDALERAERQRVVFDVDRMISTGSIQ
jgi:hypothetical protein